MKINNDALSSVVSVVVVLMIVISAMASIVFWGIPYIDQLQTSSKKEDFNKQFASIADTIDDLASSIAGDRRINPINVYDGSLQVENANIGDRIIVSYSQNSNYNFTVSGLDTCFLAGTKVLMADKSYKNIEEINIDDIVLSYDVQTNELVPCRAANVFHHTPKEMTNYYLVINNVLKVTPNHKFYSDGKWIQAGDLKVGDTLFTKAQNRNYIINYIDKIYKKEPSYDLQVEQCHNYFVSIDDGVDVLVHNDNGYIWVTPDSYETSGRWIAKNKTIDGDINSESTFGVAIWEKGWSDYLELKMYNVIPCSGFQINAKYNTGIDKMEITLWNGSDPNPKKTTTYSSWNDWPQWQQCDYGTNYNIDRVKIRFYNPDQWFRDNWFKVYEFNFKVPIPECQTSAATEITETSAKLKGQVTNNQGLNCDYKFEYDTDGTEPFTYYTWWYGPVNNIFNLTVPVIGHYGAEPQNGLTPVELYYFRAQISYQGVSNYWCGNVSSFITKPYPPSNIQTLVTNNISYSWTKSQCSSGAIVKTKVLAKTVGWPTGPEDNDATTYKWYNNDTGSSDTETGLIPGQKYNVSMWSWGEESGTGRWSDEYKFSIYTKPSDLSYLNAVNISSSEIQLSWVKAAGSHKTVIRRSTTDFPSTPSGDYIYNDTGISCIDRIPDPVENYYYSAWTYDNDSGYFSDHYATASVKMVYDIAVTSPKDGYRWKIGTTQVITWLYGESLSGKKVKILLQKSEIFQHTLPFETIADLVDIENRSYSWEISIGHDVGEYVVRICTLDDSIYGDSRTFRIDPRYDGIIDNLTIDRSKSPIKSPNPPLPPIPVKIDLRTETFNHNKITKGESFTLEMIDGQTTRFEIYWLYHEEGTNYSLDGTVCIDLYDENSWFGSIWIFDSTPITYLPSSSSGLQKVTIEKGGIINYEDVAGQLQRKPPHIYEGNDVFAIHIIQTVASSFAASGSGNARYKVYSNLYGNSAIEEGRTVFNLRLQFYGDNTEVWLKYFVDNYKFNTAGENTLFYAPSAPSMEGVKFSFAHATVELEIRI